MVDFLEAALGGVRRLALPDGRTLDVTIPAGLKDGQVLRLKGQGLPGVGEAPAGDDVVIELPVTLKEAVLGAKVAVPTVKGPVTLAIPPNSSSGTRLRLKGRGILGAHQYVILTLVLPHEAEPELADFLGRWQPRHPFDPRKGMRTT